MENVDIEEAVANAVPIAVSKQMTRAEKLNHWADLVRAYGGDLILYSNLEQWSEERLNAHYIYPSEKTAFGLAVRDRAFKEHGLPNPASLREIMNFMEINQKMMHEFSCDCGGSINNSEQADRIASLATRSMSRLPSWWRVTSLFGG